MLSPLLLNWANKDLIYQLRETVCRIPKDLNTWAKEMRRLKPSRRGSKKFRQYIEYRHYYSFYEGKMLAYLYTLEALGDGIFTTKFIQGQKMYYHDAQHTKYYKQGKWKVFNPKYLDKKHASR